jgi:hypothetical protein
MMRLLMLCFLLAAAAGVAMPTLSGPSGGAVVPDATTTPFGTLWLAGDLTAHTMAGRVAYGWRLDTEIGVALTDGIYVHAKYASPFALYSANLAVGAQYGDDHIAHVYLVGTRTWYMLPEAALSVGLDYARRGALGVARPFVLTTATWNRFSLVGEARARGLDDSHAVAAVTARYAVNPYTVVQLGLTNAAPLAGEARFRPFVGLAYNAVVVPE